MHLTGDYHVIASQSSDWRGNLLEWSKIIDFRLLRGPLRGIATSHFVLLAMTRVLITAALNDY